MSFIEVTGETLSRQYPTRWLGSKESAYQCLPMQETGVRSLGREDSPEKEMAIRCSILAQEIPCEQSVHWKRPWWWENWKQKEKRATEGEMFGWHHQLNGRELGQTPEDSERQGGLVCCSPWGYKGSYMTQWLNTTTRWLSGKESTCQCRRCDFDPWVGKMPCRRKWQSPLVLLPGKSHGQQSLVGYSPWCPKRVGYDLVTKNNNKNPSSHQDSEKVEEGKRCKGA